MNSRAYEAPPPDQQNARLAPAQMTPHRTRFVAATGMAPESVPPGAPITQCPPALSDAHCSLPRGPLTGPPDPSWAKSVQSPFSGSGVLGSSGLLTAYP